MSGNLISRKAVIDILESIRLNDCNLSRRYTAADIQERVENIPTAYDVDAVCKNLDKASDYYETDEQGKEHVQMVNLIDAIEIVRNGGRKE